MSKLSLREINSELNEFNTLEYELSSDQMYRDMATDEHLGEFEHYDDWEVEYYGIDEPIDLGWFGFDDWGML